MVRAFRDEVGREWEVIVGRESWGTVVGIFVRRDAAADPRQVVLEVSSWDEGNRLVLGMSDGELGALLDESVPKFMD